MRTQPLSSITFGNLSITSRRQYISLLKKVKYLSQQNWNIEQVTVSPWQYLGLQVLQLQI